MASSEERLRILRMIEQGQISAEDGARLLEALSMGEARRRESAELGAGPPRWFRVRVTDLRTGKNKVNVNIPVGLVTVGIKMGARFAPEIEGQGLESIMEAIRSGQQGKIMDIMDEEDGERVEIFVE